MACRLGFAPAIDRVADCRRRMEACELLAFAIRTPQNLVTVLLISDTDCRSGLNVSNNLKLCQDCYQKWNACVAFVMTFLQPDNLGVVTCFKAYVSNFAKNLT